MGLHFTEPHPSSSGRPETTGGVVYGFSRGGAGNYRKFQSKNISNGPTASRPEPPRQLSTSSSTKPSHVYRGGIGGAGNIRPHNERATYDFEHELERLAVIHEAQKKSQNEPVFMTGRGGAGNAHKTSRQNSGSSIASSVRSSDSSSSTRRTLAGIRESLSRVVSRD